MMLRDAGEISREIGLPNVSELIGERIENEWRMEDPYPTTIRTRLTFSFQLNTS